MNERIRELYKQYVNQDYFPRDNDDVYMSAKDLKNFAEMIVRECMACSTWVGRANPNAIEPVHTAHAINQRIKEYFGVEE